LADDPICDELLVLCDKNLHVWISSRKPRVSKARGLANARPPGRAKFANALPPGLTRHANAPQLPGGGWAQLELTDALDRTLKASRRRVRVVCPHLQKYQGWWLS